MVDKSAEACYTCHARSAPLEKLNRPDRARLFTDRQGHHLLAVIRPIDNAPECSNASCHVHQASQRVLGVIDADLSLATVDAQLASAPGRAHLVSGGGARVRRGRGRAVHVGRGLPAGEGAD